MKAFSLITHGPHPLSVYPSRPPPAINESSEDSLISVNDQMPVEMYDFLNKCLDKDKTRRPSSNELLQHAFLSGVPPSFQKARNNLLNLMHSLSGVNSAVRRYSEPPRYSFPSMKQTLETVGELASERLKETAPVAVSADQITNSSSKTFAVPKNLGQKYTSTISLNICIANTSSSSVSTDTISATIGSPRTRLKEPSDNQGIAQIAKPTAFSGQMPVNANTSNSLLRQNALQNTLTTAPLHRSKSEKCTDPKPTNSNAHSSSPLKTANTTADVFNAPLNSTSKMASRPIFVQEEDDLINQNSDVDMQSSGEYEKEEILEKRKEPTETKTRSGPPMGVQKISLEKEGCVTDVNGVLVYTPSTSEYRNLFQADRDDLKHFVRRTLQRIHGEQVDQVIFTVGKPQEALLRLCKLIYDEIPFFLTARKELINNAFHISEKLIGRQELSIRGIDFVFAKGLRLVDASIRTFLSGCAQTRQIFENPLFRAFNSFVAPRSPELSQTKDLSEIVQFQMLIMTTGFSPQEIVGLYRILIAISAIRMLRRAKYRQLMPNERLDSLPEDVYSCIQKRILYGEASLPSPLTNFAANDIARLIGVDENAFHELVFSKSAWRSHVRRNLISRHFRRYLQLRNRRLYAPMSNTYTQNDSGFFEDYTSSRKQWKRLRSPTQPIRMRKCFFRKMIRMKTPLEIDHFVTLKHIYRAKKMSGKRPHRVVMEILCRRLHILCVSVVLNKVNSLLHSSLVRSSSSYQHFREVTEDTVKLKVYSFIPSSKSLISNALLDLLHSRFVTSQNKPCLSRGENERDLDNFYQQQAKQLLDRLLLQTPSSGFLPCLSIQEFLNQSFPSTECDFNQFCVVHYHGKEEYMMEDVIPRLNPQQERKMTKLLRHSDIPPLQSFSSMLGVSAPENFFEILPHTVSANTCVNLMSVLDDGKSSSLEGSSQNIILPNLSSRLPGNLTSRRHLRVFQDCGLLNFAAVNNKASGLTVMKSDEFLRRFSVLSYLSSKDGKDLKSLAIRLKKGGKTPHATHTWQGLKLLPLNRDNFNDGIVKIMENCRLSNDLYFVSAEWVLLSTTAMSQLQLEFLKRSISCRRIQHWWRRQRQQKSTLTETPNFLLSTSPVSTMTDGSISGTTASPIAFKDVNTPEAVDERSAYQSDCDSSKGAAYVVANTVVSSVSVPQNYSIQQQILPQQMPPKSQHLRKPRRPPPSSGIAWYEPKHPRPPAYPPNTTKSERVVKFIESPAPRYLGRHQSTSAQSNEPHGTNLRRSVSARSVDNQQAPCVSTTTESRPLACSNSSHGGNITRENLGGVQRRIRRRASELQDLHDRRPVSWHVDQVEAQLIAHKEKQRLLNGQGSPVLSRTRNPSAREQDNQSRRIVRVTSDLSQSRSPNRAGVAARFNDPHFPFCPAKSPEAQREEYARVQAEITRGEYRRARELRASSPTRNNYGDDIEIPANKRQSYSPTSSKSSNPFNKSTLHGSYPDFRLLYSEESSNPHSQPYDNKSNHKEMNGAKARPQGFPTGVNHRYSSGNHPPRRPVTTVFDGPLTPNPFCIIPSRNSSPSHEQARISRMAFMSSPMGGKIVIPVNGRKASSPVIPTAGIPSTKAFVVDNRSLNTSKGCSRTICYE